MFTVLIITFHENPFSGSPLSHLEAVEASDFNKHSLGMRTEGRFQ